jgi:hypothetical protein
VSSVNWILPTIVTIISTACVVYILNKRKKIQIDETQLSASTAAQNEENMRQQVKIYR